MDREKALEAAYPYIWIDEEPEPEGFNYWIGWDKLSAGKRRKKPAVVQKRRKANKLARKQRKAQP